MGVGRWWGPIQKTVNYVMGGWVLLTGHADAHSESRGIGTQEPVRLAPSCHSGRA